VAERSELSWRALAVGLLCGCAVGAANVAMGLRLGLTFGASITAAVLSLAFFRALGPRARPFTVKETLIATTAGSSSGSMAAASGVISFVPALAMTGVRLSFGALVLWSLAIAGLGVLFALPLRRSMLLVEKLRYPSGTAAAETIAAMHSQSDEASKKARVLIPG
jgi:putative OPT family oligopeptide transporter